MLFLAGTGDGVAGIGCILICLQKKFLLIVQSFINRKDTFLYPPKACSCLLVRFGEFALLYQTNHYYWKKWLPQYHESLLLIYTKQSREVDSSRASILIGFHLFSPEMSVSRLLFLPCRCLQFLIFSFRLWCRLDN